MLYNQFLIDMILFSNHIICKIMKKQIISNSFIIYPFDALFSESNNCVYVTPPQKKSFNFNDLNQLLILSCCLYYC